MNKWFVALCLWLEDEAEMELYTLRELHAQMALLANGEDVYSEKHLKNKLIEHYGNHVFFAQLGGTRKDVVCFRDMASYIISDEWYKKQIKIRSKSDKTESDRIMVAAAKIVKEEIRAKNYSIITSCARHKNQN